MYSGGGIHPDIFVAIDTTPAAIYLRKARIHIPEFVYKVSSLRPELIKNFSTKEDFASKFVVTDVLLQEFYSYAVNTGLVKNDKLFASNSSKVKLYIKAAFAKQLWRLEGYYYIANADDEVIIEALKQVKN